MLVVEATQSVISAWIKALVNLNGHQGIESKFLDVKVILVYLAVLKQACLNYAWSTVMAIAGIVTLPGNSMVTGGGERLLCVSSNPRSVMPLPAPSTWDPRVISSKLIAFILPHPLFGCYHICSFDLSLLFLNPQLSSWWILFSVLNSFSENLISFIFPYVHAAG